MTGMGLVVRDRDGGGRKSWGVARSPLVFEAAGVLSGLHALLGSHEGHEGQGHLGAHCLVGVLTDPRGLPAAARNTAGSVLRLALVPVFSCA